MTGAATLPATGGFLIAGGGTGGHVFPALALAGEIRRRRPDAPIVFVGTRRGLETDLVPSAGWPLEFVRAKGLVGKGVEGAARGAPRASARVSSTRCASSAGTRRGRSSASAATPPGLSSRRRGPGASRPSSTSRTPSRASRTASSRGSRRASRRGPTAGAARLGGVAVGNPVREEFFAIPSLVAREKGRTMRVLVVGGSQGAAILNRLLPGALAARRGGRRLASRPSTRRGRAAPRTSRPSTKHGLTGDQASVREFVHDMPEAYRGGGPRRRPAPGR